MTGQNEVHAYEKFASDTLENNTTIIIGNFPKEFKTSRKIYSDQNMSFISISTCYISFKWLLKFKFDY